MHTGDDDDDDDDDDDNNNNKTSQLMFCSEIIVVCVETDTEHVHTLSEQNVEYLGAFARW